MLGEPIEDITDETKSSSESEDTVLPTFVAQLHTFADVPTGGDKEMQVVNDHRCNDLHYTEYCK